MSGFFRVDLGALDKLALALNRRSSRRRQCCRSTTTRRTTRPSLYYSPLAFAPSRPNWLHQAIDDLGVAIGWPQGHAQAIGDICATLSAIVGVLALIPPPTAVCTPLAIALSAVTLGMHLWAGDHSALDIGGDILGMVPDLDLVTDALKEGRIGMQVVDDVSTVARDADAVSKSLGEGIENAQSTFKWRNGSIAFRLHQGGPQGGQR